jgi:hypothetical protein
MDSFFSLAHIVRTATGFGLSFRTTCAIFGTVHVIETLYTLYLCRYFVKGTLATVSLSHECFSCKGSILIVQAAYVGCTLIFGKPAWSDLKKRVQDKRIESVMKVE